MAIDQAELTTLLGLIARIDENEVLNRVGEAIAGRRNYILRANINKVKVGMTVSWNGKAGPMKGKVKRIKQKYVEVETASNVVWNVPASMFTSMEGP